jgi:Asp-tRNA(Asn)/Glu-tRNA(Gln) amidotransferase A subunit family amidase
MSAFDLARAIARKKVSPLEVVDAVLARIVTYIFNMTGQPAATVPCGQTKAGLPIGLQIVGRRFDDVTVLRASAAFESARPWARRRPALDRAG